MVDTSLSAASLWDKCLDDLKYQVSNSEFTMWFRPLKVELEQGESGGLLVIKAPNDFWVNHVKDNYLSMLEASVLSHTNQIKQVVVRMDNLSGDVDVAMTSTVDGAYVSQGKANDSKQVSLFETDNQFNEDESESLSALTGQARETRPSSQSVTSGSDKSLNYIDPKYTFDTFVTGKSNNLAYKACYDLSKRNPQNHHNPLFIYGHSGLGKTHLMHSVAHRYIKSNRTFYYFTSDKFVNQMVYALRQSKIDEFKKKIKKVDLLIIDDIHVLANKPKTITEFLSLFEDFTTGNKQLVLASDRHPSQLTDFDERFRSRLSGGLSVSIDPPELDTRMQILQKKASLLGIELPKECALFIAQNVVSNVRHLEGALNQVMANANLTGNEISLEMVRHALKDIIAIRVQAVSMDNIRKVVGEFYDVSVKDMMGKKRSRKIVRPRQIAMSLARELTGDSYPEIGQSFGGRDHSTVMHACDKIAQLRSEDPVLDKEYKSLAMMLQTG